MNALRLKSFSAFLFAGCILIASGGPLRADVGGRVYIQAWNPAQPDKHLFVTTGGVLEGDRPIVTDAKAVSDAVNAGWNAARGTICDQIKATLKAANGGSKGISFTEITCELPAGGDLSLLSTRPYNSRNFLLRFAVKGNFLDMHSTTPNIVDDKLEVWGGAGAVLGGQALGLPGVVVSGVLSFFSGLLGQQGLGDWANPEFKIYYDVTADVLVDGPNVLKKGLTMFKVTNIQVSGVQANPANAPGSIIKAATDFANAVFGTPAFNTLVSKGVQDGVNQRDQQGHDLKDQVNIYIQNFNAKFATTLNQLSNYLFVGMWGKNNMISLVFSPTRVPLPTAGAIQGMIRMMKTQWFSANTCPSNPGLYSEVKVGPAPITDVDPLQYGDPPLGNFGQLRYVGPGQVRYTRNPAGVQVPVSFDCPYALVSLPDHVPNFIKYNYNGTGGLAGVSGASRAAQGAGPHASTVFSITPMGWDTHVVPSPVLTGKDWVASVGLSLSGSIANVQTQPFIDKGDPYKTKENSVIQQINPGVSVVPSTPAAKPAAQRTITPGAAQMLNPQPLPPKVQQNIQQR